MSDLSETGLRSRRTTRSSTSAAANSGETDTEPLTDKKVEHERVSSADTSEGDQNESDGREVAEGEEIGSGEVLTGETGGKEDEDDAEAEAKEFGFLDLSGQNIPQDSGDAGGTVLQTATDSMSKRWKNWTIRGVIGVGMILFFMLLIYMGQIYLMLLVLAIQLRCYSEIINIGYVVYKSHKLPWFRTLSWYFLFALSYLFYGETLIDQFDLLFTRWSWLNPLATYHRFISMTFYLVGFVAFVTSLVKRHYIRQFTLFGYTHVTLLVVVVGSHFIIRNIFEGTYWFFLSTSLIICNDIWAYYFGFFFGRTPLIKLSPKKTWEGFIGGGFATVLYAVGMSYCLANFDWFVCPLEYNSQTENFVTVCKRNPVFVMTDATLPAVVQSVLALCGVEATVVPMYPVMYHAVFIALFASIIGPFGGFFASGFKRAFRVKDFGDIFPGHGGFMDRFDCQILMGLFVHVYVITFIRVPNSQKLISQILFLPAAKQLEIFSALNESLSLRDLI